MRIQVITSGDNFSTADVCRGLIDGLRANGHTVDVSELADGLDVFSTMVYSASTAGLTLPHWAEDAFALSAPRIISQAAWFQPDTAIAVTELKLHPSVPLTLRKMGIPVALLCTESPYDPTEREIAPLYDHVFTNERTAVSLFGNHPSVHYLPHAYNPAVHMLEGERATPCDVFFVGTAFPERKALLGAVDWRGIDLQLRGAMWHTDDLPTVDNIRAGAVDPWQGILDNTAAHYRSARINLNHHRTTTVWGSGETVHHAESLGPRAYEIAACGGFMLCDDTRDELFDVFGDVLPLHATYSPTIEGSLELTLRYWLKHDDECKQVAAAMYEAVKPHSWHARAQQVTEVLFHTKQLRRAA
jgi:hypothetical protein